MYYGIKEGIVSCKANEIINLHSDIELYVEDLDVYCSGDFYNYDTHVITPNPNSINRIVEVRDFTAIYEMKPVVGFVENLYGITIANLSAGTCVFRITPLDVGATKFVLVYASTVQPFTFSGTIRIGSWRLGELFQAERYLPTTNFSYAETTNNIPIKRVTPIFNIETLNEMIIIRVTKNAGTEAGNLYILAGVLKKD